MNDYQARIRAALERFATEIETLVEAAAMTRLRTALDASLGVAGSGGAASPTRARRSSAARAASRKRANTRSAKRTMTNTQAITRALEKLGRPASIGELREAVGALGHAIEPKALATALARAREVGVVSAKGEPKKMRYALAKGAAAPAGAAKPA